MFGRWGKTLESVRSWRSRIGRRGRERKLGFLVDWIEFCFWMELWAAEWCLMVLVHTVKWTLLTFEKKSEKKNKLANFLFHPCKTNSSYYWGLIGNYKYLQDSRIDLAEEFKVNRLNSPWSCRRRSFSSWTLEITQKALEVVIVGHLRPLASFSLVSGTEKSTVSRYESRGFQFGPWHYQFSPCVEKN